MIGKALAVVLVVGTPVVASAAPPAEPAPTAAPVPAPAPVVAPVVERLPAAVLWLAAEGDPLSVALTPPLDVVESIDRALEASPRLRGIGDLEVRRSLVEGGPQGRVATLIAVARRAFAAQHLGEAEASLAEAENVALRDLPVEELRAALTEIESARLINADFARDEAAAAHALRLLAVVGAALSSDLVQIAARHPASFGPQPAAPPVRVESDPPGAQVFVDLRPIGVTPIDLPADRHPDALIDIALTGHLKVHRSAPGAGTLAVALAVDERPARAIDRLRLAHPPIEAELADLGRRLGARRLATVRLTAGGTSLEAHVLDVAGGRWDKGVTAIALATPDDRARAGERLTAYLLPPPSRAALAAIPGAKPVAKPKKEKESVPGWKKWYTWVVGGALAAAVIALVVADHVGDDKVTVKVMH